jgi:hypothetical protein
LDAKEEPKVPEILDSKLCSELIDDPTEESGACRSEDDVVDVDEQVRHLAAMVVHKQRRVGESLFEPHGAQMSPESIEPGPGRLLEAIEGLGEEANMIRVLLINEPSRLMAVELFGDLAVQERVLDVELVHR